MIFVVSAQNSIKVMQMGSYYSSLIILTQAKRFYNIQTRFEGGLKEVLREPTETFSSFVCDNSTVYTSIQLKLYFTEFCWAIYNLPHWWYLTYPPRHTHVLSGMDSYWECYVRSHTDKLTYLNSYLSKWVHQRNKFFWDRRRLNPTCTCRIFLM